ncbi:MAG: TetR/AcrR family transcriptional regulator [Frankia sp.]
MATVPTGRVNQKRRTRTAIVEAARTLLASDGEVSMPAVARAALVSEATAYRYFPDLASLLREAFTVVWSSPAEVMAPIADSTDPVERVGFAAQVLLREVLAHQGAVRAVMAAAITKPEGADVRPGRRFGLIDHALAPLDDTLAKTHPDQLEQLRRSLAIVVSAEAVFTLTDLYGLAAEDAIASVVRTARTITEAILTNSPNRGRDTAD